ncbi:MAG: NUDIX hydrolase [Chitinophagaceae bacterium]
MEFNIRVYGVLVNEHDEVLVSDEYIKGLYITKFPGGGLEFGEGTKDCLKREFKEETGLDVTVGNHIYTTDYCQVSAFNPQHQILSIYYYVHASDISTLKINTQPFDFPSNVVLDKTTRAEVFRFISKSSLNADSFSLPIDKIVAQMLSSL